jgi:hypothetical protein
MSIVAFQVPSITRPARVEEVSISLSEFKPEEIAEYLRSLGYAVDGTFSRNMLAELQNVRDRRRIEVDYRGHHHDPLWEEGVWIEEGELSRAATLAMCGQREAAREHILAIVSAGMERPL